MTGMVDISREACKRFIESIDRLEHLQPSAKEKRLFILTLRTALEEAERERNGLKTALAAMMGEAQKAQAALVMARPDVTALLAGKAVVVPKEVTNSMLDAAIRAWTPGMNHADAHEERYRAMLAASPYAKEPTP